MTATTKTKTAKPSAIRCKLKAEGCKVRFYPKSSVEKYCAHCKPLAKNTTRRVEKPIPRSNHFFVYLAREVERAGSLEALTHLKGDVDAMTQLYKLVCFRMKANLAAGDNNAYHISHIAPVKGHLVLGAIHPANLVITTGVRNQQHGNTHLNDAGIYIERQDLVKKHTLKGTESWAELIDLIISFLGEKFVSEFAKKNKLKDSSRVQLAKKLVELIAKALEEGRTAAELVPFSRVANNAKATVVELQSAVREIQNKKAWDPTSVKYNEASVAILELARHTQYRPELETLSSLLSELNEDMAKYSSYGLVRAHLDDDKLDVLFDLMHGEEVSCEIDEWIVELQEAATARRAAQAPSAAQMAAYVERQTQNAVQELRAPVVDDAPAMSGEDMIAMFGVDSMHDEWTPF
ncbi:hypothetical protein [Pseudomonas fulva]|uniref:hypothetical protein n=1 Tax=Pseudomonas fulva TaxID=47880 RepID=UPI0011B005C2|nr:hypothetical protein [Pseudomonas fulva]